MDQSVLVRPHSEHKFIRIPVYCIEEHPVVLKTSSIVSFTSKSHPKKKTTSDRKEAGHFGFPQWYLEPIFELLHDHLQGLQLISTLKACNPAYGATRYKAHWERITTIIAIYTITGSHIEY